jgi:hypothetical protein
MQQNRSRSSSSRSRFALLLSVIAILLTSVQSPLSTVKAAPPAPTQPDECQIHLPDCDLPPAAAMPNDWYPSDINRLYGSDTTSGTGLGSAFAFDEVSNTLAVAASTRDSGRGAVYIYSLVNNQWVEQTILTASDGAMGDRLGHFTESIAFQGNLLVVGTTYQDNNRGAVYLFMRTGSTWTQAGKISGVMAGGFFGRSINLGGNTLVISASHEEGKRGAVYVYSGSGSTWTQQARVLPNDPVINSEFGTATDIEDNTLVVGRPTGENTYGGAVYVFTRNSTFWVQTAKIKPNSADEGENVSLFGSKVMLENCVIVATSRKNRGTVYAFDSSGCLDWIQTEKWTTWNYPEIFGDQIYFKDGLLMMSANASTQTSYFRQIHLVQKSGSNWIGMGYYEYETNYIASTIFKHDSHILMAIPLDRSYSGGFVDLSTNPSVWISATDSTPGSRFGTSIVTSGNTALISAEYATGHHGAGYVYVNENNSWRFQAKLSSPYSSDVIFGQYIALHGDYAVVSSENHEDYKVRLNVFNRNGETWSHQATIEIDSYFPNSIYALAIHASTIAVYMATHDSICICVFERNGLTWTQTQHIPAYAAFTQLRMEENLIAGLENYGNGSIRIFERSNGEWSHQATITIENDPYPVMGNSFDLSNGRIMISSTGHPDAGVFTFKRTLNGWIQEQKIRAPDIPGYGIFGSNIALQGNRALITRNNQPLAHLFILVNGVWEQQRMFYAPFFNSPNAIYNPAVGLTTNGMGMFANTYSAFARGEVITFDTFQKGARRDTIGIYRPNNSTFYLKQSNTTGNADYTIPFGTACGANCNYPVVGDWNSDGIDTIGLYHRTTGVFSLRNSNTPGTPDLTLTLGNPGDTPLAGRWATEMTGDGVGVFRPTNGILYLKKQLTSGVSDFYAVMGNPSDIGIAGDWDGDMIDNVGIYRPNEAQFYLSYTNGPAGITYADTSVILGNAGDSPVVGDWEGLGHTGLGVFRPTTGQIYMKNFISSGFADKYLVYGDPGDIPIAGRWSAPLAPPISSSPNILVGVPNSVGDEAIVDENAD